MNSPTASNMSEKSESAGKEAGFKSGFAAKIKDSGTSTAAHSNDESQYNRE